MKIRSRRNFRPRVIFAVKSLKDFQTLNRHKVNAMTARNKKNCGRTKVWVLNLNLASNLSYDRILNNFQNEAVN